jgi:hypothetical protein
MRLTSGLTATGIVIFAAGVILTSLAGAASPEDACSLLTQAQVNTAVGVAVGAGKYVTPQYRKTCTWTASDSTSGVKDVTLFVQAADAYEGGKALMQQAALMRAGQSKQSNRFDTASAAGIGEDAYYTTMGYNYTALMVKKGNHAFKVAIYGTLAVEKKKAAEKALGLEVASRL